MFNPVFDTVYVGSGYGGSFFFQSLDFAQGQVMMALDWAKARKVDRRVRSVCFADGSAVLRSRLSFRSREDAEASLSRFLSMVKSVEAS